MADGNSDRPGPGGADPTPDRASTDNTLNGDVGAAVQASQIHGDVHITGHPDESSLTPRQLPLAAPGFVNRRAELARLDSLLAPADGERDAGEHRYGNASAVVISAIDGTPGIGKTALALHWAHRVRSRFTDGDLYVNLHGHGPHPQLDAAAALESLLRTLGVPPDRIPADLDGRAALFRSRMDGKHVLVLLDDAVSAEQVRPLLPASSACLVLVTSRSTLPGLATREGARKLTLDTLTAEESLALLSEHLGAPRLDAEPAEARALVGHCARLPLALRVLAERLNELPDASLASMAADLLAEDERLDALGVTGDALSDVRAVFSDSYHALPDEARHLFRSLGAHPSAEFTPAACAAAAAIPLKSADRLLQRLAQASLVQRVEKGRYRLHDLLRVYAIECFRATEPEGQERVVLGRLAAWYLGAARSAVEAVMPNFRFVPVSEAAAGEPPVFASPADALAWFAAERAAIVQTIRAALDNGLDDVTWRLPATVYPLFEYRWHWAQWQEIHLIGLEAARASGDRHGEARNLIGLADAEWSGDDSDAAVGHYAAALSAARDSGDGWTEGFALRQLGALRLNGDSGDLQAHDEARELLLEAVQVFRGAAERRGEGMALLSLAECERSRARFDSAEDHARAATALFADIADIWTVAWAGCSLAAILSSAERHDEAAAEYEASLAAFREGQHLEGEAVALLGSGRAHAAQQHSEEARSRLGAALDILRAMEDPRADQVESEIAALG